MRGKRHQGEGLDPLASFAVRAVESAVKPSQKARIRTRLRKLGQYCQDRSLAMSAVSDTDLDGYSAWLAVQLADPIPYVRTARSYAKALDQARGKPRRRDDPRYEALALAPAGHATNLIDELSPSSSLGAAISSMCRSAPSKGVRKQWRWAAGKLLEWCATAAIEPDSVSTALVEGEFRDWLKGRTPNWAEAMTYVRRLLRVHSSQTRPDAGRYVVLDREE
jgi:hypothetical protein